MLITEQTSPNTAICYWFTNCQFQEFSWITVFFSVISADETVNVWKDLESEVKVFWPQETITKLLLHIIDVTNVLIRSNENNAEVLSLLFHNLQYDHTIARWHTIQHTSARTHFKYICNTVTIVRDVICVASTLSTEPRCSSVKKQQIMALFGCSHDKR